MRKGKVRTRYTHSSLHRDRETDRLISSAPATTLASSAYPSVRSRSMSWALPTQPSGSSRRVFRREDSESFRIPHERLRRANSSRSSSKRGSRHYRETRSPSLSPSHVWTHLPVPFRILSLIFGFILSHYLLFAKHHQFDREVVSIEMDLETLIRKANETGLGSNLEEAELPEIFRPTAPSPSPSNKHSDPVDKHLSKPASPDSVPLKAHSEKLNTSLGKKRGSDSPEKIEETARSKRQPLPSDIPHTKKTSNSKISSQGAVAKEKGGKSKRKAKNSKSVKRTPKGPSVERKTKNKDSVVREKVLAKLPKAKDKKSSKPSGINGTPLVAWDYESIEDPSTKEQIFGLGAKHDHVTVYKPLCIDTSAGEAIAFSGKRICNGFNRTAEWWIKNCEALKEMAEREYLLKIRSAKNEKEWISQHAGSIKWVEGLTIFQMLETNCGNIAHFAGRALMLQHVIENIAAYASAPSVIENILVVPTFHIMKRFLLPHNYDYWHKGLFTSIVSPAKYNVGTLGEFLRKERTEPFSGIPRVQLLSNFSASEKREKIYVCFRRAVVPGFLKGRFFVDDIDYPSTKPSLQAPNPDAPKIPRDSLRVRERVNALLHKSPELSPMKKDIVLLDRPGPRRAFGDEGRRKVIEIIERVARENGYSFKTISFEGLRFKEQYKAVERASIAIGIHGANLVNAMFMTPLSVLIELFPFGFGHGMYENGGNAGLKYFPYEMATGTHFDGSRNYESVTECIRLNHTCKVHYRDSELVVTPDDLKSMETILRTAVKWCDNLPSS